MSASAQARFYTGASPGSPSSDITGTTIRYKQADDAVQNSNNPVPLPGSGLAFSWRKSTKVNWSTTPASGISNLRWFLASNPATGLRFFARVQSAGVYVQANSNDQNGITGFTDTGGNQTANDATNYTSGSPLSVNSGTVLSNPNTGEGSQVFVETQGAVASTYTGGPGGTATWSATYRYSET